MRIAFLLVGTFVAFAGAQAPAQTPDTCRELVLYGERLNQVDLRVGKILRFGRTKTSLNLDLYNLFNVNTVLTVNNAFATWQRPTSILLARFAKIGVQFDF